MAFSIPALIPSGSPSPSTDVMNTVRSLANTVLTTLFIVAGIIAVVYLIWAGFQYISSRGEPDKAKSARASIINAGIGIVIIVSTYGIIRLATSLGSTANNLIGGTNPGSIDSNSTGGSSDAPPDNGTGVGGNPTDPSTTPDCTTSNDTAQLCILGYAYYPNLYADDGTTVIGHDKWCRFNDANYCVTSLGDITSQTVAGIPWYRLSFPDNATPTKWCRDSGNCLTPSQFEDYKKQQTATPTPTPVTNPTDPNNCLPGQYFDQIAGKCVTGSPPA